MNYFLTRSAWCLYCSLLIVLTGCSTQSHDSLQNQKITSSSRSSAQPKTLLAINSIYLAPPIVDTRLAPLSKETEASLYNIVQQVAKEQLSLDVTASKSITKGSSPLSLAAGQGADGALITTILSYKEREGSSIGVTQPASISLEMQLVNVSNKSIVWSYRYSFTDKSLSEDIISYGRKLQEKGGNGGWTTADVLFKRGVSEGLENLSQKRNEQFLAKPIQ